MEHNSAYNILMYSHDTYGLGHIRRTMAIASHLRGRKSNIIILTGSPIAGRYSFPDRIDFVRIPGMIKKTNEEYLPLSIKINPDQALDIRKNIITATAKTFKPSLFIVDKEPMGLKKEILPTLEWLQSSLPGTRTILGLRDIMDDARTIREDWEKKGIYEVLGKMYSEIWVYGIRDFYDPVSEYAIPESISKKIHFTGYIPRRQIARTRIEKVREEHGIHAADKLVVVTTGGGGDGFEVMHHYLSMIETQGLPSGIKSILITGPFMPKKQRKEIFRRARRIGITTYRFYRHMIDLLASADLAVSMGGYNTVCEILSQGTVCLLIPRDTPRQEQLIRARIFHERNLLDYLPWDEVSSRLLREKVIGLLESPAKYQEAMSGFQMTGIDTMRQRLSAFRNENK